MGRVFLWASSVRPSSAAQRQEHKSLCAPGEKEGKSERGSGRKGRGYRAAKEAANRGGERRESVWPDNWSRQRTPLCIQIASTAIWGRWQRRLFFLTRINEFSKQCSALSEACLILYKTPLSVPLIFTQEYHCCTAPHCRLKGKKHSNNRQSTTLNNTYTQVTKKRGIIRTSKEDTADTFGSHSSLKSLTRERDTVAAFDRNSWLSKTQSGKMMRCKREHG